MGRAPVAPVTGWESSLDRQAYAKGVAAVREAIAAGDVYQVNLCRRLSAPLPAGFDVLGLGAALFTSHPAPHQALVRLPSAGCGGGVGVARAVPAPAGRRGGVVARSRARPWRADGLTAKDRAENVMIVDLVRNDLGRVCEYGSVEVPALWEVEAQPGLVHLVSTVRGRLRPGTGWADLLDATFPPGSVTGAPKLAALDVIAALEPVPRGVYCGAVGWVDADRRRGRPQRRHPHLLGRPTASSTWASGAGITWDSDPVAEWEETELKARRLLAVAGAGRSGG